MFLAEVVIPRWWEKPLSRLFGKRLGLGYLWRGKLFI